ncbi:hypothetical protein DWC20_05965 [Clostridium botulinum]|uniref:hypothetical protein n=1 Tax=Clostridium botulinum TaxID=1491 RepID=UPI0003707BE5|nr:hypothetical protein [Clostridium botulinum]MBN1035096.1 hypothetical protein [Clostridium botulinum]
MWDGIKRIITLKKLILAFEGLGQRFYEHFNIMENEIAFVYEKYLNKKNVNLNEFFVDYEQIVFKVNGFSEHALELLKIAKDYIDGIKNEYDCYVTVDVENFKHKRRNFKKHNKRKLNNLFSKMQEYKANRNIIVHDCILELNTYVLENKDSIYTTVIECKKILKEIYGICDEIERKRDEKRRKEVGRRELGDLAEKFGISISGAI